jgi:hypothetical protein
VKALFGKRLPYFIALLVLELLVIFIIVIWTFRGTDGVFRSVYDFLSGNRVVLNIFEFIWNYAEALSGIIVLVALLLLFISFMKYRRERAVNRLHSWARNSVVVLAQYHQQSAADPPAGWYIEVKAVLDKLTDGSRLALDDARVMGGEINARTRKTVEGLRAVREKLAAEDASLYDDLQDLQHDFADVMILAFEFVK